MPRTDWERLLGHPAVRAYLAAFDAWIEAGGSSAPEFVTDLKDAALVELLERRSEGALVTNPATADKRVKGRALKRREARIREAEKAIRWTLNYLRTDLPAHAIRRGAEALVDGGRVSCTEQEGR